MSNKVQIVGDGLKSVEVINKDEHNGMIVFTEPLHPVLTTVTPLLNVTYGADMNQNITFAGTPEVIFDGAGGGWTGTAIQGNWNFADSGKVTITQATNGSEAKFDDAGTINMSNYTAISGKVDLDTYSPTQNTILVQFGLAGVAKGVSINLNEYIDTGTFTEQSFIIPKSDLQIDNETVDI
jgi:hypothetical protein